MLEDASNQELLAAWNQGSQQAADVLVRRYMVRLTALAGSRLSRKLARRIDAEDIVMSAWRSFFVGASPGRFQPSEDDNLWPLLVTITLRKIARQAARHSTERRNFELDTTFDESTDWRSAVSKDPSPDEAAILVDEVESLFDRLDKPDREVLTRRLQGEDLASIADAMNRSERTIGRSMQRIRSMITDNSEIIVDDNNAGDIIATDETAGRDIVSHKMQPKSGRNPADTRCTVSNSRLDPKSKHSDQDFRLLQLIGVGAFGKVYRSVCSDDGATVAVKFLKKRFWKDRRARECLLRETHLVSGLNHPNIIRHRGWGETQRGALFLVMHWIDGPNIGDWFHGRRDCLREVLRCGIAVADALVAAHASGLVHGDVTPKNVLRRSDGTYILTDFGFSTLVGDTVAYSGGGGGTPGFIAPEQVSELFGPVGVPADVYGFGGLIYSLLTGSAPMDGHDIAEILANVLLSRPPRRAGELTAGVPPSLDELLAHCLQKEPRARPQSMTDVRAVLRKIERQI